MVNTLRFLGAYARRHIPQYLGGFVALVATSYAVVEVPAAIGEALDVLKQGGPQALLESRALAVKVMVLALIVVVARTLSRVLFFNPGREIEYGLGLDLFERLLGLQRPFFNRRKTGELVSIISNDTTAVRLLVGFAGLQIFNVVVAIPMHLAKMWQTDPVLTLWCLTPVSVGAVYMRWTVKRFFTMVRDGMQLLARVSERVLESYSGVATIRSHGAEEAALARFQERNQAYLDLQLRVSSIRAFGMPVLGMSGLIGAGIVLWVGGNRVIAGSLSVGALATFTLLLGSLVATLTALAWVLAAIGRGIVAADRVAELLHTPDELPPVTDTIAIEHPPRLEIRDLSFAYPGTHNPVLQSVNATVEPGQTLGIFGKTGSGKTTLVNLLTRVYTPPAGSIWLDGHDVRAVDLAQLRAAIAVVPQTPFLFSTSLRDNIVLPPAPRRRRGDIASDKPSAAPPDPRLDQVLAAACLADDVETLADGIETVVGERGVMLSGGQRQRAAFARALYRHRPVLILDDVLSSVDQGTEAKMVAAIRALSNAANGLPPTTVIVSHRTSALEHADQILVLDSGCVVECGTHSELVGRSGLYAQTHKHQEDHR